MKKPINIRYMLKYSLRKNTNKTSNIQFFIQYLQKKTRYKTSSLFENTQ